MSDKKYVLAVDQGTTSCRAILFDHAGTIVATGQKEFEQIFPRAGWVEHDPNEIWQCTREVVGIALSHRGVSDSDVAAVGITNQRETAVVWDKTTGEPVYNAIVWQDTRTQDRRRARRRCRARTSTRTIVGLPLATYFSGPKVKWILDNVEGAREKAEAGDLLMGTIDSWVLWNLTGGTSGGVHITDVTNASRTMLMDIDTLDWDESIAGDMGIPMSMLPEIRSSSEVYGDGAAKASCPACRSPASSGDQQAATVRPGLLRARAMAKNTYGTGCFMLMNTGTSRLPPRTAC
jgi:glycerol kinase